MNSSFVEVDSFVLRKACEVGIAHVHEIREEALEKLVDKAMSKKLFKPKSREEAKRKLKKDSCIDMLKTTPYEMVMMRGMHLERVCKDLIGMSHLNPSVFLSRGDYEFISKFFED